MKAFPEQPRGAYRGNEKRRVHFRRAVSTQLFCCWLLSSYISLEEGILIIRLFMDVFGMVIVTRFKLRYDEAHSYHAKFGQH